MFYYYYYLIKLYEFPTENLLIQYQTYKQTNQRQGPSEIATSNFFYDFLDLSS